MNAQPSSSATHRQLHPQALLIEPDPAARQLCRIVLQGIGFSVREADVGVAAAIAARERTPDLILLAYQLPDVSGQQAIGWLRSNPSLQTTPIIIMAEIRKEGSIVEPDVLLHKPLTATTLGRTIRTAMK